MNRIRTDSVEQGCAITRTTTPWRQIVVNPLVPCSPLKGHTHTHTHLNKHAAERVKYLILESCNVHNECIILSAVTQFFLTNTFR